MPATAAPKGTSSTVTIKPIDHTSIHRITSGQVVIDLQTAVKELVENSVDAGATNIEVRFKQYGLTSVEVVDNGSGIAEEDHESIALKHHTSKLSSFEDLSTVRTFGFRGEALSSLCAVCERVSVSTATDKTSPAGVTLELESSGKVGKKSTIARQRGTTIMITSLFKPLPVRRKELERNLKREFGKALSLLTAYALGPCATGKGVRFTVSNQADKGQKSIQLRTQGTPSSRASVTALWGPKSLENVVDLDLSFEVEQERVGGRRSLTQTQDDLPPVPVRVVGLVSKFAYGSGRTGTDRQFFYVNGRPCNLGKIQKAFNEVYRSFNANQAPFILADFIIPTESCDINVSPDKRTIFLHSEANLISALKAALETQFAPTRATYDVGGSTKQQKATGSGTQSVLNLSVSVTNNTRKLGRKIIARREKEMRDKESNDDEDDDEGNEEESMQVDESDASPNDGDGAEVGRSSGQEVSRRSMPVGLGRTATTRSSSPVLADASSSLASDNSSLPQPSSIFGEASSLLSSLVPSPVSHRSPDTSLQESLPPLFIPESEDETEAAEKPELPKDQHRSDAVPEPVDMEPSSCASNGQRLQEAVSTDKDVIMVLDTRKASWSRSAGLHPSIDEDQEDELQEDEPEQEAPPHKKRKSDVGAVPVKESRGRDTESRSLSANSKGGGRGEAKEMRKHLRNRLAGFARGGSQAAPSAMEEDGEDDDEGSSGNGSKRRSVIPEAVPESTNGGIALDASINEADAAPPFVSQDQGSSEPIDLTLDSGEDEDEPIGSSSVLTKASKQNASPIPSSSVTVTHPEIIKTVDDDGGDIISLKFDIEKVKARWAESASQKASSSMPTSRGVHPKVPADAGVSNTEEQEKAADALARIIEKEDFLNMDVVGQFNLGFIVVRRKKELASSPNVDGPGGVMDDLFIVDQHAADEKYNFETLQQTTRMESQKLFRPQALELTASDELLAMENIEVLQQNGFELEVDGVMEMGQGGRIKLTAQPVSKSTTFDMKDLEELIHLLRDRPTGQMVRCSKARAMFAMRACRKSVMVGMSLSRHQMSAVVRHMGTMDQPWNCPHGRPTMRHLLDMENLRVYSSSVVDREIDWSLLY